MQIKQINYAEFETLPKGPVFFIRPFHCKVIRVHPVHQSHRTTGNYEKIIDLLNMTASRFSGGIYFFYPEHIDNLKMALKYLYQFQVEHWLIEKEQPFGHDQNNIPIAEFLN